MIIVHPVNMLIVYPVIHFIDNHRFCIGLHYITYFLRGNWLSMVT